MNKFKRTLTVLLMAGASVVAWEGGSALIQNVQFAHAEQKVESTRQQLQNVEDLATVFRNVAKVIEPSVVQIEVHKTVKGVSRRFSLPDDDMFRRFFHDQGIQPPNPDDQENGDDNDNSPDQGDYEQVGTGSGVIMEVDGSDAYIVTNNHVAGGATEMTITLSDGRVIKNGKTLGADPKSDLALVKISADHLMAAKWGDSDQLDQGDWVLAFGSPFHYIGSMTHGIVSALNRQAGILGQQGYENFIQVDAPINPGNSGGPLVDIHGNVVGINTAIATQSGGFQGIGFAIPSNQAKTITATLKAKGKITRGWLGVEILDVHRVPEMATNLGYTKDTGVIVRGVLQNTPSAGKLLPGDIITALNGKPVNSVQELRNEVANIAPDAEVKLSVFRDQKQQDVTVKIGEQPDDVMAYSGPGRDRNPHAANENVAALGIRLNNVTDELAEKYGLGDARDGALVTSIDPRSPAGRAGIQIGDLITRVDGQTVANVKEAGDALSKLDIKKGITLYVTNRAGSSIIFVQNEK